MCDSLKTEVSSDFLPVEVIFCKPLFLCQEKEGTREFQHCGSQISRVTALEQWSTEVQVLGDI